MWWHGYAGVRLVFVDGVMMALMLVLRKFYDCVKKLYDKQIFIVGNKCIHKMYL